MNKITKTFQYGGHRVTLETGRIARQANGAVLISMGETVILVSAVGKKTAEAGRDFFPLTVNYIEKSYAAGKVPGGYFKREGRPSEKETLVSRLIDRPLRPLFPKGFTNEVQIIATVMSIDKNVPTDIPAIIGSAAALAVSGIPFNGPVGAARVGYRDGQYLLNPSNEELQNSTLDLVVAGTQEAVLMVESEAKELSESVMLGAVLFGHEQMQVAIQAIKALAQQAVSTTAWSWQPPEKNIVLEQHVKAACGSDIKVAYQIRDKLKRQEKLNELRKTVVEKLCTGTTEDVPSETHVGHIFHDIESNTVRQQILDGEPRIDGRDTETVRPITVEVGVLPRTHGSALFTRGETQALVVTTLGTERDAQLIDDLEGEYRQNFMLHYNFPPFCVGEVGFLGSPKRREIGHGRLARRGIQAVLPQAFPYVVRVVSEITESNGSSSMASVCGTSLALMDAGVPTKGAVAGIAMGLVKEGNKFAILSDIMGDEDHLGDMDFKVAGTVNGVTALQMDIKIEGITKDIMQLALAQAKRGRLHILDIMNRVIQQPRTEISDRAPKLITIKIHPDKIRDVIGKGGATIREITEKTKTSIDLSDEGVVTIAAENAEDGERARKWVEDITTDLVVGQLYQGSVIKLMDFGAIVSVLPGKQGLVHISQISQEHVEKVSDYLNEGQVITVKVIDIDRQGRVRLSMKEVNA